MIGKQMLMPNGSIRDLPWWWDEVPQSQWNEEQQKYVAELQAETIAMQQRLAPNEGMKGPSP